MKQVSLQWEAWRLRHSTELQLLSEGNHSNVFNKAYVTPDAPSSTVGMGPPQTFPWHAGLHSGTITMKCPVKEISILKPISKEAQIPLAACSLGDRWENLRDRANYAKTCLKLRGSEVETPAGY